MRPDSRWLWLALALGRDPARCSDRLSVLAGGAVWLGRRARATHPRPSTRPAEPVLVFWPHAVCHAASGVQAIHSSLSVSPPLWTDVPRERPLRHLAGDDVSDTLHESGFGGDTVALLSLLHSVKLHSAKPRIES